MSDQVYSSDWKFVDVLTGRISHLEQRLDRARNQRDWARRTARQWRERNRATQERVNAFSTTASRQRKRADLWKARCLTAVAERDTARAEVAQLRRRVAHLEQQHRTAA